MNKGKQNTLSKKETSKSARIILILAGVILGILFSEFSLRFLVAQKVIDIDKDIISDTRIFSPDLGYVNKPYSSRIHSMGKYKTTWNINQYGFRDFDYAFVKPQNVERILVLGDSMVFGMGVESYESFPKILETKLDQSTKSAGLTQVLNMGVLGYGPIEYKNLYLKLGKKFDPDLVIVGFFLGNDSLDSLWVDLNKKYIFLKALPDQFISFPHNQWFKEHSYLWLFLLSKYYSWVETKNLDTLKMVFNNDVKGQMLKQVQIDPSNSYMKKSWSITEKVLSELISNVSMKNKVVIVIMPTKEQILPDEWKKVKDSGHNVDERLYSQSGSRKELLNLCGKYHWNCLDLQATMRSQKDLKSLFLEDDFHLSPIGNQVVSDTLIDYLSEKNLLE